MAGIKDLIKQEQSQIADDEYYAGLQSLLERDPLSKEMNVKDITYPFMEKSGEYNYGGMYPEDEDTEKVLRVLKKKKFPISSESSFKEKLEKGEKPIMIFEEPVSTGTEPGDLDKITTILHEARHKVFDKPEYKKFMKDRDLDEETFVRFLDSKIFPEIKTELVEPGKTFRDPEKSMKKYNEATDEFLKMVSPEEKSFLDKVRNMFKNGGRVDKAITGRNRDI